MCDQAQEKKKEVYPLLRAPLYICLFVPNITCKEGFQVSQFRVWDLGFRSLGFKV